MQPVDVLGHDGRKDVLALQLGQLAMGGVGRSVQGQHAVAVEVEELAEMGVEEAAGYHGLGRIGVALGVEPVGTAEIGDAAFCGHAGTPEEHHAARRAFVNPLAQLLNITFGLVADHGTSFPHPIAWGLGVSRNCTRP